MGYRKLDDMGRIVIPSKIRDKMGWDTGTQLDVELDRNKVIIKRPDNCCIFCGSTKNVFSDLRVCRKCAEIISGRLHEENK